MDPESLFDQIHNSSEEELLELAKKTETLSAKELAQIIEFLQTKAKPLKTQVELYDTCGTGGDGTDTFNISTAASFVGSCMGIKVAKNGGRATSSKTGSVDVLEALGLDLDICDEKKLKGLEELNLGFFSSKVSAELLAPIKQICKKHKQTCFTSLIGPMASPLELTGQMIGVGKENWLNTIIDLAKIFVEQGKRKVFFVIQSKIFGTGQILDELSCASESVIHQITDKGVKESFFKPQDFGTTSCQLEELKSGNDQNAAAQIIENILANKENNAKIQTTCLNAGLLNCLSANSFDLDSFHKNYQACIDLLKSGKAKEKLEKIRQLYYNE